MKTLVVLCLLIAAVYGLPAKNTDVVDDSAESFFMFPFTRQHNKEKVPSVVEVDVGDSSEEDSFFPSYFRPMFFNPFSFMNFGFSDFFSRPSWFDSLLPKEIPDDALKNTTSVTKVIDGHKITVNKTTFENEKNGAVFKLQVIEVSPVESKEKEEPTETKSGENVPEGTETKIDTTEEVKPDHNTLDNEIHREEMLANYELQGDDPFILNPDVEMINLDKNPKKRKEGDLTDDIRVNTIISENNRRGGLFMVPPEVEVFDTIDYNQVADAYQNHEDQQVIIQPNF